MGKSPCKMCGVCCRAIAVPYSYAEIVDNAKKYGGDWEFVKKNWVPLNRREAKAINPVVKTFHKDSKFYKCKQLGLDNKCLVHDERPDVCKYFPWYENHKTDSEYIRKVILYSKDCGYEKYRNEVADKVEKSNKHFYEVTMGVSYEANNKTGENKGGIIREEETDGRRP